MLGGVISNFRGIFYFMFFFGCGLTIVYRLRLIAIGYRLGAKGFVANFTYEDYNFIFPVYFLFLVCCFSGRVLSWFFLSDLGVMLRGLDYLIGLILVFSFSIYVFFVGHFGIFSRFLGGISFLV